MKIIMILSTFIVFLLLFAINMGMAIEEDDSPDEKTRTIIAGVTFILAMLICYFSGVYMGKHIINL